MSDDSLGLEHFSVSGPMLAWVLSTFNALESDLDFIILRCIAPPDHSRELVEKQVLHNSVLDAGKKFRLVSWLAKTNEWEFSDKYHDLLRLRNAFAHGFERHEITFGLDWGSDGKVEPTGLTSRIVVQVRYPHGNEKTLDFAEAFEAYQTAYQRIKDELREIKDRVPPDPHDHGM